MLLLWWMYAVLLPFFKKQCGVFWQQLSLCEPDGIQLLVDIAEQQLCNSVLAPNDQHLLVRCRVGSSAGETDVLNEFSCRTARLVPMYPD